MKKKNQSPPPNWIDAHFALIEKLEKQERSVSEILATFQGAGILDKNGEFTKPYSHLAKAMKKITPVTL